MPINLQSLLIYLSIFSSAVFSFLILILPCFVSSTLSEYNNESFEYVPNILPILYNNPQTISVLLSGSLSTISHLIYILENCLYFQQLSVSTIDLINFLSIARNVS
jgi:hypothetical protein